MQNWRENVHYAGVQEIVWQAFVREHFFTNAKLEFDVVVMNMYKEIGKQLNEMIVFEGWPRYEKRRIVGKPDGIVKGNLRANEDEQTRQNLK